MSLFFLISLLFIPPCILLGVHYFFESNFLLSSLYKIIFLLPVCIRFFIQKKTIEMSFFEFFSVDRFKRYFFMTIGASVLFSIIYYGVFLIVEAALDTEIIIAGLKDTIDLNTKNIWMIGAYIIVLNSLLEEFFWRGFLYKELRGFISLPLSCIISAIAFSFHHIFFYYAWFSIGMSVFVTFGLTCFAILMNVFFEKTEDLFSCWLIHASVDVVQIVIALRLFSVL